MSDFLKDIEDRRRRQSIEAARIIASIPVVEEEEPEVPEIEIDFLPDIPETPEDEIVNYSEQNKHFEETISSLQNTLQERDTKIQGLEEELRVAKERIDRLEEEASRPTLEDKTAEEYPEGATATNPTTGEKVTYRNGKWVPLDE